MQWIPLVYAGTVTMFCIALLIMLARGSNERDRMRAEYADQLRQVLELGKAESLDQFAAVERRFQRDRAEAYRDRSRPAGPAAATEEPVAQKAPTVLQRVWARPPRPAPADTAKE
jgi:hypothetical protein